MLRLYTDESPGLKVDPVVVLVLSLVFIFSVVALHSKLLILGPGMAPVMMMDLVDGKLTRCQKVIAKITRRFSS